MEKSMSFMRRLLAMLLVFALVIGYVPMGAGAEELPAAEPSAAADETTPSEPEDTTPSEPEDTTPSEPEGSTPSEPEGSTPSEPEDTTPSEPEDTTPSELVTSIEEGAVFALNVVTPFTYTTVPNDDAGKMVKGSFEITQDGAQVNMAEVAKLEYQDSASGEWFEFYGDFGPADGFPMMEATSNFRITFIQAGNYTVTVSMVEADVVLCSNIRNIVVEDVDSELTSSLAAGVIAGRAAQFQISAEANSDIGKNVTWSFEIKSGDTVLTLEEAADLQWKDADGNWAAFDSANSSELNSGSKDFAITFKTPGSYTVTASLVDGDGNVLSSVTNEVVASIAQASFSINGEAINTDKWYSTAQTVTVLVENVAYAECLAAVTATEGAEIGEWKQDGSNWTLDVKLSTTGAVTYGDQTTGNIQIDTVVPTAEILESEVRGGRKNKKTTGSFTITVGESKLGTVTIEGVEIKVSNDDLKANGDGTYSYTGTFSIQGSYNPVSIIVTNAAGVSGSNEVIPQPDLEMTFTPVDKDDQIGEVENVIYLPKDNALYVVITVSGAEETGAYAMNADSTTITALDQDGNAIDATFKWDGENWVAYVSLSNGLSKLSATFTDNADRENRTVTEDFNIVYAVDKEDPVVVAHREGSCVDGTQYFNSVVTYTFTVSDVLLGDPEQNVTITYTVNGEERTAQYIRGEWTFTINDGETLTDIAVYAIDATGNATTSVVDNNAYMTLPVVVDLKAPVVTATVSDNVKYFYTAEDGRIFAVLDPMDHKDENTEVGSETVTLTITVEDANLDVSCFTGGNWTDNGDGTWSTTFTAVVDDHQTGELSYEFTVKDLAAWLPTGDTPVLAHGEASKNGFVTGFELENNKGAYAGSFSIDRRSPNSNPTEEDENGNQVLLAAPTIVLNDNGATKNTSANDLELYEGDFQYDVTITDISTSGNDAGVKNVYWSFNDDQIKTNESGYSYDTENQDEEKAYVESENNYSITVDVPENYESNNVILTVIVEDYVGNKYSYYKAFAVDTKTPEVSVVYDNNEVYTTDGVDYYNANRVATITVSDLNLNQVTITLDGASLPLDQLNPVTEGITTTYTLSVIGDAVHDVQVTVNDLTVDTHETSLSNHFVIDTVDPTIEVVKAVASGGAYIQTAEGVDYYDGTVTYTVTVQDVNLSTVAGDANVAVMYYEYETGDAKTVNLTGAYDEAAGMYTYTGTIVVENDEVLTTMNLQVVDNANNRATVVACDDALTPFADMSYYGEQGIVMYTGNAVAVDLVNPEVKVTKVIANGGSLVQTYTFNEVEFAYYAEQVTYTVEVIDNFLDPVTGTCVITVTYTDGSEDVYNILDETVEEDELLVTEDFYDYTFTLDGSKVMENIAIQVVDNAGRVASKPNVEDAADTDFALTGDTWNYTGNPIVVDTVLPTAEITFSENVKGFYNNGNTIYVILNRPIDPSVDVDAEVNQTVTMTITVVDNNVAIDNENIYGMKATTGAWKCAEGIQVNAENVLTYTFTSSEVAADGTCAFDVDVNIRDLAGNMVEAGTELTYVANVNQIESDGTAPVINFNEDGNLKFTVSLDRRRPTSMGDAEAPEIEVIPSIDPIATLADGSDLFNNPLSFSLKVEDGSFEDNNAGIYQITWTLTDANGVIANDSFDQVYVPDTYSQDLTIPVVMIPNEGETNVVTLTVTAEDNVGNRIRFQKVFGVDNLAPRITFTTDENTVATGADDGFFNFNRYITMTVEDLNFVPGSTHIETQGAAGIPDAWTSTGENTWSKRIAYVADGDYSLKGDSTDLALNTTAKGGAHYSDNGVNWIDNFTIDQTAPVITVSYTPAMPVDTDNMGVQYFDEVRNVTVTINEHNFDARDVFADLGDANALGNWTTNGDTHTAGEMFTEGNNYRVTVSYTDRAGNPAVQNYVGPTFSVDLHTPEIVMTKGNMSTSELNPVAEDLILGFTVTDNEDNLKNFDVQVTFVGQNFKSEPVTGEDFYTLSNVGDRTTGYIDFTNIIKDKGTDGIYTVIVTATDYAGHVTTYDTIYFSLNRFGSVFTTDDTFTRSFLDSDNTGIAFQQSVAQPLVIKELNPNEVWQDSEHTTIGSIITIAVNGNTLTLVKDVDYTVEVTQMGEGMKKWYEYTYVINPSVFYENEELIDGEYTVFFYSEDKAGNKNSNENNHGPNLKLGADGTYSGKVNFTLDHQKPVVTILGIEDGQSIWEASHSVEINTSDASPVGIAVYINDVLVEYFEDVTDLQLNSDWLTYDAATGSYKLNMSEKKTAQNVKVVVTDAAGNDEVLEVKDVVLTESLWYQYINSLPAMLISGVLGLALIILIIVLMKKRKNNAEGAAV